MRLTQFFLSWLGGLTLWVSPFFALAQEYIDVEAERLQQQSAPSYTETSLPPPVDPVSSGQGAAGSAGELYYQLQLLQQEVMELRGMLEEQAYQLRQLKEQSMERYLDLDSRLKEGGASEAGQTGETGTGTSPTRELAGESDAYRAAYSLVRSQQFAEAVTAFRQFLVDFPSGRYAPNAHYWLGELYLVTVPPDDESARREFNRLLEDYPKNGKVPDALYKLGRIYFDRGDRERAMEFFDRVINEFEDSGSSAIKLAQDFIRSNY
jgi:tol-pal system protein YbgF